MFAQQHIQANNEYIESLPYVPNDRCIPPSNATQPFVQVEI